MGSENPLQIFPEEIWEIILKKCVNIGDMLKALPQLRIITRGKELSWLIGDIMALLFPKLLSFKDIKQCRLVSRRWKMQVDKCLESHSDLSPYNSFSPDSVSPTHFNYHPMPQIISDFFTFFDYEYYNLEIKKTWTTYNPFPGRCVLILLNIAYDRVYFKCRKKSSPPTNNSTAFPIPEKIRGHRVTHIISVLEKVGHHIWYVTIRLPAISCWLEKFNINVFMQYFIGCLVHLPNLKSLKLDVCDRDTREVPEPVARHIIEFLNKSSIPAHLETLDLLNISTSYLPKELFTSFLSLFVNHSQVKKIMINARDWSREFPNMFPNLTELCIQDFHSTQPEYSFKDILGELVKFPCLQSLRLWCHNMNVAKILQLIPARQIQSLELVGEVFEGSPKTVSNLFNLISKMSKKLNIHAKGGNTSVSISSIRILKMKALRRMDFEFLNLLPSLQVFHLKADYCYLFTRFDTMSLCFDMMLNGHKYYVDCFKKMWDAYPRLNIVAVEMGDCLYQCVREEPERVFLSSVNM